MPKKKTLTAEEKETLINEAIEKLQSILDELNLMKKEPLTAEHIEKLKSIRDETKSIQDKLNLMEPLPAEAIEKLQSFLDELNLMFQSEQNE